jgi:hypothetical protein
VCVHNARMSRLPPATTLWHRARREARTFAGRWPAVARRFTTGEFPTEATEICIEGFLRAGNTFTVIAFQHAQPAPVSVAHHVHAAGAVIAAVRMRTPTLVLIRAPAQSVLSYVVRWPELTIGQALRGYARFYRPLLPYRDGFVVGGFDEVTSDLGRVIRRVNERFGTRFVPFEPTEANLRAVGEEMDRWDANTYRRGGAVELGRGRPTEEKESRKAELLERYRAPSLSRLRERAEHLYRTFAADAR